jgi:hypothetical protein
MHRCQYSLTRSAPRTPVSPPILSMILNIAGAVARQRRDRWCESRQV